MLLLYTDGLTEARDQKGEEFGEERLVRIARETLGNSAEEIQEAVHEAVLDFSEGNPQYDDMTLLVLQYRGSKGLEGPMD
jgi:sigma-B regulation protein RsbU (phosphoserine phosphatase)